MKKWKQIKKNKTIMNIYRYLMLFVAILVSAITFNLFLNPSKIVAGGTSGLSIIFSSLFNWKPSLVILIVCATIEIFSLFTLGYEKTSSALLVTLLYPLFVELTSGITAILDTTGIDLMLVAIFAGLLSGWTSGIICKMGLSAGGIIQISQIIHEKTKLSISKVNFVLNTLILIGGGYVFGITKLLYAIIVLYINSIVIDKVLLGISDNKAFFIVTEKEEEVKKYIIKDLKHGVTVFDVKGGYNDKKKTVLMAVVPTMDYFKATAGIKEIDDDAFFVVTDSYQVEGGA